MFPPSVSRLVISLPALRLRSVQDEQIFPNELRTGQHVSTAASSPQLTPWMSLQRLFGSAGDGSVDYAQSDGLGLIAE